MDIGDFISAFGTGYQRMQNKRSEDKDGKDKYLTKPTFCRELFCSITSNEGYVLYKNGPNVKTLERSPESFKAFYRNHQRRSLHPIANDIISLDALDEMKFRCFLEEYTVYCSKKQLLKNFSKHIPDITMETLFDDISAEFVRILNDEAQKPDGRRKSSSPESIKVDEETQDGLINAFATTYQKEMSLSNNLSDISSEICKETVLSYTITDQDKQAILNICDLIIKALQRVKVQTDRIDNKQRELKNISNTEAMLPWKASVEYDLNYLAKSLDEEYSQLERLCSDAIIRLEPKMHIHGSLAEVYTIATELLDNRAKFDVTCPDTFSYDALTEKLSEFTKHVKLLSAYFKEH